MLYLENQGVDTQIRVDSKGILGIFKGSRVYFTVQIHFTVYEFSFFFFPV